MSLRKELDDLRSEFEALRTGNSQPASTPQDETAPAEATGLEHQINELNRLVHLMLNDAEEVMSEHPVATVAGALALGIVIGRITTQMRHTT